jgi:predicted RecA/RadA family phage recombinase
MATSTLIQFLEPGEAAATSNRSQTETFLANATITAGDWVAFDLSQTGADKCLYVIQSSAAAQAGVVCGVALQSAVAGDKIDVCTGGYCAVAAVTTAVAAGSALIAVAGGLTDVQTAGAQEAVCGTSLTVAAANVAEVFVASRF